MRLTARRWATALAVAVLVHAAGVAVLLRQASEPGAGAAGPGVIRVSLGQAGGTPTRVATEPSGVPEVEMTAAVETATSSPIDEAVPTDVPAMAIPVAAVDAQTVAQAAAPDDAEPAVAFDTSEPEAIAVVELPVEEAAPTEVPAPAVPVEGVTLAESPPTPKPVETVNVEMVVQGAAPRDAVPIEAPEPVVSSAASESAAVTVAEMAVALPVEEVASISPEPVGQTNPTADAIEVGVVVPAEALASPAPVEAIGTVVRQAESSETQPTALESSDRDETIIAEAVTGGPIEEVNSASPEPATPMPVAADSIETEMTLPVEATAGPAPPDADVKSVERVQPVEDRSARHLASAPTGEPREESAGRTDTVAPSSGESDAGQSTMPAAGSGARVESVGDPAAHHGYLTRVLERIARFKRYPREARRDGVAGKVMVRFTVLADGSLESPRLTGSSGDNRLDQAALRMLSRASPFPPIPRSLGVGKLELSLPVQFSLNQKRTLF